MPAVMADATLAICAYVPKRIDVIVLYFGDISDILYV